MLIEVGISKEEVEAAVKAIPAGTYHAEYTGLYKNPNGEVMFETSTGGHQVKPKFKLVNHPDANVNGRSFISNAVIGSFSFSEFVTAVPDVMSGSTIDDEKGIGTLVTLQIGFGKGEYADQNQVKHIKPV